MIAEYSEPQPTQAAYAPASDWAIGGSQPVVPAAPVAPAENSASCYERDVKVFGWLVDLAGEGKNAYVLGEENFVSVGERVSVLGRRISGAAGFELNYNVHAGAFYLDIEDSALLNRKVLISKITYLRYHDMIRYGNKEFIFVPLCDAEFGW